MIKDEMGSGTQGVSIGTVDVKKSNVSSAGTDGAFGFDISIPVSGQGMTLHIAFSIRGFLKRHTEVTLTSSAFGQAGTVDTDGLYQKLVTRAKASAV